MPHLAFYVEWWKVGKGVLPDLSGSMGSVFYRVLTHAGIWILTGLEFSLNLGHAEHGNLKRFISWTHPLQDWAQSRSLRVRSEGTKLASGATWASFLSDSCCVVAELGTGPRSQPLFWQIQYVEISPRSRRDSIHLARPRICSSSKRSSGIAYVYIRVYTHTYSLYLLSSCWLLGVFSS